VVGTGQPTVAVDEQTARIFVGYDLSNTVSVLDATHR
jgi:DNA-binding beta-propeller fold protein YncE